MFWWIVCFMGGVFFGSAIGYCLGALTTAAAHADAEMELARLRDRFCRLKDDYDARFRMKYERS